MTTETVSEAQDGSGPVKNYAAGSSEMAQRLRERIRKEILPMCEAIRQSRSALESQWASFEKAWTMEHELQSYLGRSNIYMPVTNKQVETLVGELVTATFPGDDFFSVEAEKSDWQGMAADVKALEGQRVRSAKVRSHAEAFYRQMLIKGNSPGRTGWFSKKKQGHLRKRKLDSPAAMEASIISGGDPHTYTYYEGPRFTPIPIESFYAWPENCSSLDDCLIVFEDLHVPYKELLWAAKNAQKYDLDEVKAAKGGDSRHSQVDQADQNRLQAQEMSGVTSLAGIRMVAVTHCFLEMDPRAESFDEEEEPIDVCVSFTPSGQVLRVVEAETVCPGRCHPYVNARAGTLVSRLWGTGFVERVFPLQLLVNDQMNQAMDCASYQLNPIVKTNPNLIVGPLPDLEPGVQLLCHDIAQAVGFDRPPDFTQSSSMLLTQTISFMQDFFGSPPVLQGGAAPGRAFKTAAGVTTADKNAKTPLQQMVRLAETDVWEVVLQNFWLLDQRYATDQVLIEQGGLNLSGQRPAAQQYLNPMSMYGEYKFRWLASTQAANQQVMAQMLQNFITIIIAPAVQQLLGMEGFRVQIGPLIERIYRALGLRDVERVLLKVAEPQPGLPPPPSDSVEGGKSAQQTQPQLQGFGSLAGNAGQDPAGNFGELRMAANQLASAFGGEGGMPGVGPTPGMMPDGGEEPY